MMQSVGLIVSVPSIEGLDAKTRVAEILNRWPAAGPGGGGVRNGALEWFYGHGAADIASNHTRHRGHGL